MIGQHVMLAAFLAVLALPAPPAQPAFDQRWGAFVEVLCRGFGLPPEHGDVNEAHQAVFAEPLGRLRKIRAGTLPVDHTVGGLAVALTGHAGGAIGEHLDSARKDQGDGPLDAAVTLGGRACRALSATVATATRQGWRAASESGVVGAVACVIPVSSCASRPGARAPNPPRWRVGAVPPKNVDATATHGDQRSRCAGLARGQDGWVQPVAFVRCGGKAQPHQGTRTPGAPTTWSGTEWTGL